jgi:NitT/TauT family transport system substrate-binding protein
MLKQLIHSLSAAVIAFAAMLIVTAPVKAETAELRIVRQYGLAFLPIMVMDAEKLYQKRAAELGIGTEPVYMTLGSNTAVNEALISGSVNIVTNGPPGFLTAWSRTKGTSSEIKGISSLVGLSCWLNTRNPNVKSIRDFTNSDRIALSAIKISIPAIILQMAAAKAFGQAEYSRLDKLTVSLSHPDGMSMLLNGKTEITAHFTSPPFQNVEAKMSGVHTILTSDEVMGGPSTWSILFTTVKFKNENPKAIQAFVRALDDAQEFIKANPEKAADIYLAKSKEGGVTKADVLKILGDGSINYALVPRGIMAYANFMKSVGTLKFVPTNWKEPFFEYVQDLPGS